MLERLIVAKPATETEWLMQPGNLMRAPDTRHLDVVAAHVEALPPRLRLIIERIHFERATYRAVASTMNISHVHVWRLAKQAERMLAESLSKEWLLNRYVEESPEVDDDFVSEASNVDNPDAIVIAA